MNAALKRQVEEAAQVDALVDKQREARGREIGTVHVYEKGKGFGFILDSDHEKLFVHHSMIVASGFRRLEEGQKVSFIRGENRGKPWCEDVRSPDGTPIVFADDEEKEAPGLAKKRRQQLKEQWRNFFDIPQYALKSFGESLPATVANQDQFVLGDVVPQLGKVFVLAHGCTASTSAGNECTRFLKEKMSRFVAKAYEEKNEPGAALQAAFELAEIEWMERAKNKSLIDGAEVSVVLFVHALNAAGQPCVQLWIAGAGTCTPLLCSSEGVASRVMEPHSTKKGKAALLEVGFDVNEDTGVAKAAFGDVGSGRPAQIYKIPATRMIGGRPFKTTKALEKQAIHARPEVKKVKEWRCVAGEELFLLICSSEVLSVISDQDAMNAALDAWGGGSEAAGYEAAAKAVVRTAQAYGPDSDQLACLAVQFWWQEKPLQRLLARRADQKKSGVQATVKKPVEDDEFSMFG